MTVITDKQCDVLDITNIDPKTLNFGTNVKDGKLTGFIEAGITITLSNPRKGYTVSFETQYDYKSKTNPELNLERVKEVLLANTELEDNEFIFNPVFNPDGHLVAKSIADERAFGYCIENLLYRFKDADAYDAFAQEQIKEVAEVLSFDGECAWIDDVDMASEQLSMLLHESDSSEFRSAVHKALLDKLSSLS